MNKAKMKKLLNGIGQNAIDTALFI